MNVWQYSYFWGVSNMKRALLKEIGFTLIVLITCAVLLTQILSCGGGGSGYIPPAAPAAAANKPPVGVNDMAVTYMNTPVDINVLTNDVDPDGDTISVANVTQGSAGFVSLNASGSVKYVPNTSFTGTDTFSYTVTDNKGGIATPLVTVKVAYTADLPIERVNTSSTGTQANASSWMGAISPDGRYVAFLSQSSNLVAGDNGVGHIFVRDRLTNGTTRVSIASDGTQGNSMSQQPTVSSGGRYIAFMSWASNLVGNDNNGKGDIFVLDRGTGSTTRVSVDSVGAEGNSDSFYPAISADGRYVAFFSSASNLVSGDANGNNGDIFIHDQKTGLTELVSLDSNGNQIGGGAFDDGPSISGDGRYVAFKSGANIYVRDRQTATTILASVASDSTAANDSSDHPAISSDGHYVAFTSIATNLVAGDTNGVRDVFVHNLQNGETIRASVATGGAESNGAVDDLARPAISSDGRYVSFASAAMNLVANDTNMVTDVFVHDCVSNQTSRVSVGSDGTQANGPSEDHVEVSIADNGEYIAFTSSATNLILSDTNNLDDVFAAPNPLVP
jgi:hypothetical protein